MLAVVTLSTLQAHFQWYGPHLHQPSANRQKLPFMPTGGWEIIPTTPNIASLLTFARSLWSQVWYGCLISSALFFELLFWILSSEELADRPSKHPRVMLPCMVGHWQLKLRERCPALWVSAWITATWCHWSCPSVWMVSVIFLSSTECVHLFLR